MNYYQKDELHRRPGWARAADIVLRTAHIAFAGILLGGYVFDVDPDRLQLWLHLTGATGVGLILSDIYHRRHWFYQCRGVLVILKLLVGASIPLAILPVVPILATVLVIGAVGSHMPKRFRYWSVVHRRVLD
jgi:hypothetical protein